MEDAEEASVCLYADAGAEPLMELLCSEESSREPHHHCAASAIPCYFPREGLRTPKLWKWGDYTECGTKGSRVFFSLLLLRLFRLSSGARAGGAGEPEAKESISRLERPNGRLINLGTVIVTGSLLCVNARGQKS